MSSEPIRFEDCPAANCPVCGDKLIHQAARRMNESSSVFGQHVHDTIDITFYAMDIDQAIYKRQSRVLRIVEVKPLERPELKQSQRRLLPLLALAIDLLCAARIVHSSSGVFYVVHNEDFTDIRAARINGSTEYLEEVPATVALSREQFKDFISGEPGRERDFPESA